ncbi:Spore coat protein Z [Psychrobacillus sp. OK028]|uniref:CotY/CotZ family spore coat protein n=1 Tax=Psychrobacillus sp. OK028 TaxID=1884359 RepID=UPI000891930F|nr:CotY/CotZ family spore coat protein [Psychrobacillus sp. OK028]SDN62703.1 Spore coat protein Z [Psychrobacillus sp. OK028]
MNSERISNHCICEALFELKILQDLLQNSQTKFFGNLLAKIVGTDTIPFLLVTQNGEFLSLHSVMEGIETKFFRIESVDLDNCCATISLLRPLDIEGSLTNSPCDVVKLEKTSICKVVDVSCICAIQPLDTEMLKRKIIIEPKW